MRPKKRYLPDSELKFNDWQAEFVDNLVPLAGTLGVLPGDLAALQAAQTEWKTRKLACLAARTAARAATETKDEALAGFKARVRTIVGRIQKSVNMTDDIRELLTITVPDREPTPLDPGYITSLPAPLVVLDFSVRGICRLHIGVNPSDERNNGLPPGVYGAQVWYYEGGTPPEVEYVRYRFVGSTSQSPFIHILKNTKPVLASYRVRWQDRRHRFGPFGDPVEASITP